MVAAWLRRRVAVDRRALAAVRIGLGSVLLLDLLLRARHLRAFYTDAGVLPRESLQALRPGLASVSIHALSGAAWFQWTLFALTAVAALAVLVGYRTRLATLCAFLLVASLHARNPVVLNAGDSLLRRLLLWGCLLPLGARWSIDATRRVNQPTRGTDATRGPPSGADTTGGNTLGATDETDERVVSVATAGLVVQATVVYLSNVVVKLQGSAWTSGDAVRYVFQVDRFTILLGELLAGQPTILTLFTWAWLGLLVLSPGLLLTTGRRRTAIALALVGGHAGMLVTMWLGVFPLVSIVSLLPFLSGWDRLDARLAGVRRRLASTVGASHTSTGDDGRHATHGEPTRARVTDRLTPVTDHLAGVRSRLRPVGRRAGQTVAVTLLLFVAVWNGAALAATDASFGGVSPTEHRWDMFAPSPPSSSAWFSAPANTSDGRRVDAFSGGSVDRSRPTEVANTYPSVRWRKYLVSIWWADSDRLQRDTARYLCDRRADTHDSRLSSVSLVVTVERTRLGEPESLDRRELATVRCGNATPATS